MPRGATNETMNLMREKSRNPAQWNADVAQQERDRALLSAIRGPEKQTFSASLREWLSGPHL